MNNKLITLIITLVVGVILTGSLLVPVVNDYSSDGEHTLDVVVIAGQSNAAYRTQNVDLTEVNDNFGAPATNCYFYGYDNANGVRPPTNLGELDRMNLLLFAPMYNNTDGWRIGSEEVGLAYTIGNKTHNDVYTINVALSGQAISVFEEGAVGGNYATTLINDAISKIPDTYTKINRLGWIWIQGESDKTTAVDTYIESFRSVQSVYNALDFDTCYMVQTQEATSGNAYEAHEIIADTFPNVIMATTAPTTFTVDNGLLADDELHYTQEGRNIVGVDVGNSIAANQIANLRTFEYGSILQAIPIIVIVSLVVVTAVALYTNRRD